MAIIELGDLRGHLDIDLTSDNPLLQEAIESAQSYIEDQTNRKFEAETDTRYYDRSALDPDNSKLLNLYGDDLLTVTTLTNGDSSSTAIAAANYWLVPRNSGPPYHGILLKTDISDYWEWDTDYWVTVAGTWGYSTTPPYDIRRACILLASYFFRQKDSAVFEVTAILESGALAVPSGIPATVDRILARYRRSI
jgi:hypothetical protein